MDDAEGNRRFLCCIRGKHHGIEVVQSVRATKLDKRAKKQLCNHVALTTKIQPFQNARERTICLHASPWEGGKLAAVSGCRICCRTLYVLRYVHRDYAPNLQRQILGLHYVYKCQSVQSRAYHVEEASSSN